VEIPRLRLQLTGDVALASRQTSSKRNPAWTRDELILALELYLKNPAHPPSSTSEAVQSLSAELNKIGQILSAQKNQKFRNANGVYMKMMNFRRFDPDYTASVFLIAGKFQPY
jgi:hypothetical protein